jgi:tripartite-type tricarboxylate transporter receptor subunit TctC
MVTPRLRRQPNKIRQIIPRQRRARMRRTGGHHGEEPMTLTLAMLRYARSAACGAACVVSLIAAPQPAAAQAWPTKTIQAIIPFAAGNANDVVGRIVLDQLSRQLGHPIIVDNRAGAGGTTGVAFVAKAAPDGYTILVHSATFSSGYSLYKSLPYDTFNDFIAVIPLGIQPTVLVAAPSKGWKTLGDLVAAAKARPGELNFASAGIGAASHLAAERFRVSAGFTAQHVPFRGPVEALTEVMTGRIDFYFLPVAPALPLITEGKLIALAVSTEKRASALPNVPTTAEAGLKDAAYAFWNGVFVPAKTPPPIVTRIYDETQKALAVPSVQERLLKVGQDPLPMNSAEFEKFFHDDVRATAKLMKEAGVQQVE